MRILVTGATGAIGPRVVAALRDDGHLVRSLAIDPPGSGMFPEGVESLVGDILDEPVLRAAMRGVEAVVHMAALLHIVDPPPGMRARFERINVDGTEAVVAAARSEGVRRVVFFSTIAVYGPTGGRVLDETSPVRPDTLYAETKRVAERAVLGAVNAGGRPLGTVLRLGAVYGARIKGNYERLTIALSRGRFIGVGNGRNRRTLIYDRDVARAAVLAVAHPAAAGRVFNVTDGAFPTMNEIVAAVCAALGRRPHRVSLPAGPIRALAGAVERGYHLFGRKPPVTRAAVDKYTDDCAVDGSLIRRELGFEPAYDLRSGWAETIREMKRL